MIFKLYLNIQGQKEQKPHRSPPAQPDILSQ